MRDKPLTFWARLKARWQNRHDEAPMESQTEIGDELGDSLPLAPNKESGGGFGVSEVEEELPLLPSSTGRGFSVGGDIGKTILVSFVTVFVALIFLSFIGGIGFVTKQDFTANMGVVSTTVEQIKGESTKGQNDIATAIQGIPSNVTSQVNAAVKQSVSQWDGKLSLLESSIDGLTKKVNGYEETLQSLDDKIVGYEDNIQSLRQEIADLQNQYGVAKVSVDETASLKIITNGIAVPVPLKVTNNSDVSSTIPVKLVLTSTTTSIVVNKASMSGAYSVSINGSTVMLSTTAEVKAGSSVTFNIWVALDYTGTSPNIWSAVWSKQ